MNEFLTMGHLFFVLYVLLTSYSFQNTAEVIIKYLTRWQSKYI